MPAQESTSQASDRALERAPDNHLHYCSSRQARNALGESIAEIALIDVVRGCLS